MPTIRCSQEVKEYVEKASERFGVNMSSALDQLLRPGIKKFKDNFERDEKTEENEETSSDNDESQEENEELKEIEERLDELERSLDRIQEIQIHIIRTLKGLLNKLKKSNFLDERIVTQNI